MKREPEKRLSKNEEQLVLDMVLEKTGVSLAQVRRAIVALRPGKKVVNRERRKLPIWAKHRDKRPARSLTRAEVRAGREYAQRLPRCRNGR